MTRRPFPVRKVTAFYALLNRFWIETPDSVFGYLNEETLIDLLRIERTLHRHAEAAANCDIVEDDNGKTYRVYRNWKGEINKEPCRNMQAGAIKRLTRIAKETGLTFYVQTDPRGCSLYAFTPAMLKDMHERGLTMEECYYPFAIAITI